ncbi:hypothetical protein [Streptomyces mordarskii]|uniref:Secreted protein/lipoprotein n=1 Tax=Streptomyces mordarskii TaxID=1226758 RepID=A0ABN1EV88_9ACTN
MATPEYGSRTARYGVTAIAVGVALAVSSCGGGDGKSDESEPKHPSKSAASTPAPSGKQTSSDPQAADKEDLLAAYGHFWDEQTAAYAKASSDGTKLTRYATGDALARAESELMTMRKTGNVLTGAPVSHSEVTGLDMDRKVPKGSIRDCLDVSKWKVKNRKTGEQLPAAKGRLERYVTDVKAEKWGKQWMILSVSPQKRAC